MRTKAELFKYLRSDIPAGVVVFLVALPLCLGIALASGAPLMGGLISGAVGGLVVTAISGSHVSVSGPTAGLALVIATGISEFGSYEHFLMAVVLAGFVQMIFAVLRAGSFAAYIPNSVINGMLAAIGLIIILKQIPHALGRDSDFEGDMSFWQITDKENTFTEIVKAVYTCSPAILAIAFVSGLILILWAKIPKRFSVVQKYVPAPLVAIAVGISMNEFYGAFFPHLYARGDEGHLVSIPVADSLQGFFAQFTFPVFDPAKLPLVVTTGIMIAIVASVETVLSIEAGDKIDPYKRVTDGNRELFAQGVGNITSGLLGGLPLTSVVVRTSANIYAGARTKLSSLIHGALLVIAVMSLPTLLNRIPLSSLAAVLIVVGYKLCSADLLKRMYKRGSDQFLPFVVTVSAIVFSNVLFGVLAGLITSMFFVVKSNYHSAISVIKEDDRYLLNFTKDVSFVNKGYLKQTLASVPNGTTVTIDGRQAIFIDNDIYDIIDDFKQGAPYRGINVELRNLRSKQVRLFNPPRERVHS